MRPAEGNRQYIAACLPLRLIISVAYWLKPTQISGGPEWLDKERFDIVGQTEKQSTIDELHVMMQNLLVDRFKLQFHREPKEMPAYVLTVDAKGPKNLQRVDSKNASDVWIEPVRDGLNVKWTARFAPLDFLAYRLSGVMDRPVVNQTGMQGQYDFEVSWTEEPPMRLQQPGNAPPILPSGPTVFEAMKDQLGLKLEARRVPVDVLVVDRIDKPAEN